MKSELDSGGDLKSFQDDIYRDKVLRARGMTPSEKLQEGFDLTTEVFERMLAGVMNLKDLSDPEEGWLLVDQQLQRLRDVEEKGRYTTTPPKKS